MNAAANDLKNSNEGDIRDIGVSVDGSWQIRGGGGGVMGWDWDMI